MGVGGARTTKGILYMINLLPDQRGKGVYQRSIFSQTFVERKKASTREKEKAYRDGSSTGPRKDDAA